VGVVQVRNFSGYALMGYSLVMHCYSSIVSSFIKLLFLKYKLLFSKWLFIKFFNLF
jgi:hypothetical protein